MKQNDIQKTKRKINKLFKDLRKRQQEAATKAKAKKLFFLLAKCRFGKTPTGINIVTEQWGCDTVLVVSGISVREGWSKDLEDWGNFDVVVKTNDELIQLAENIANDEHYYDGKKVAIFVMTQKLCVDYKDAIEDESAMALADWFNTRAGNKAVVFDEAHFAEQAKTTKEILAQFQPTHQLYITATGWTKSLKEKITEDNQYVYGLKEEYTDFINGALDYKYIKLFMYCLDKTLPINDDTEEGWAALFSDEAKTRELLEKALTIICDILNTNKEKARNIILYVRTKVEGEQVINALGKVNIAGYTIYTKSAVGNSAITQTDASKFYNVHKTADSINIIISCNRLGTGTTIPELNTTMFCCPTKSAIKFVQYSMRGISQLEDGSKDKAYVFCFNRFGAFEVYSKLCKELEKGRKKKVNKGNFSQMQAILPFFCEDDSGVKQVDFMDIAAYNEQYAKGQVLFYEFDTVEMFEGFKIYKAQAKQVRAKIVKAAEKNGISAAEANALVDAAENATTAAEFQEAVKNIATKTNVKLSKEDKEVLDVSRTRKLLQDTFVDYVETAVFDGIVTIDSDHQAVFDEDILFNDIFSTTFSRDLYNSILDDHSEYITRIANTIYSREAI